MSNRTLQSPKLDEGSRPVRKRPDSSLRAVPGALGGTLNETKDDYPYVVAVLGGQRVIESSCRIQWIVQKREGRNWRSIYFCRTKAGLLLYAGRTKPDVAPPPPSPELLALPDRFPEAASWPVTRNVGKMLNVALKRATATSISATVSS
jgi:hypothetical protein